MHHGGPLLVPKRRMVEYYDRAVYLGSVARDQTIFRGDVMVGQQGTNPSVLLAGHTQADSS